MPPDRAEVDQTLLCLPDFGLANQTNGVITGISLKTQELYALVFLTRYVDLFFRYISLYVSFKLLDD